MLVRQHNNPCADTIENPIAPNPKLKKKRPGTGKKLLPLGEQKQCIERYHFSAVSSLAALHYQYGMASYRMESMSDAIGMKIADSTQFSLFEKAASLVRPYVFFLEKNVANGPCATHRRHPQYYS